MEHHSNHGRDPPPIYLASNTNYPIKHSTLHSHPSRVTLNSSYNQSHLYANNTQIQQSSRTKSRRSMVSEREGTTDAGEIVSESGASVVSAFRREGGDVFAKERVKSTRRQTDSPLRRGASWMVKSGKSRWSLLIAIVLVLWVKWTVGLGSYSGALAV